jgi:hypothetical protein
MINLLNMSYMRKASLANNDEDLVATSFDEIVRNRSKDCYTDESITEEEREAIEEGIVFLNKVTSGENPINGGYFREDSFYIHPLTIKYLRDVCKLFKETGEINYGRYAEARTFLRNIGRYIHYKNFNYPVYENNFYGETANLVFFELAELLMKHCKPLIKY